jgi:hypothetical protein
MVLTPTQMVLTPIEFGVAPKWCRTNQTTLVA